MGKFTDYNRAYAKKRRSTPEGVEQNRLVALAWRQKNARKVLVQTAKARAKKRGHDFSVAEANIMWPTHCPVFGTELIYCGERGKGNLRDAASLDRLDNAKGYVPGNVFVLSWRANSIKNDATSAELRALANWVDIQTQAGQ